MEPEKKGTKIPMCLHRGSIVYALVERNGILKIEKYGVTLISENLEQFVAKNCKALGEAKMFGFSELNRTFFWTKSRAQKAIAKLPKIGEVVSFRLDERDAENCYAKVEGFDTINCEVWVALSVGIRIRLKDMVMLSL